MINDGDRIGRVCPAVSQQCRLRSDCVLFEDPKSAKLDLHDKVRAWLCDKRGVAVYAHERETRLFSAMAHPIEVRVAAPDRARRRLLTLISHLEQLALFPEAERTTAQPSPRG